MISIVIELSDEYTQLFHKGGDPEALSDSRAKGEAVAQQSQWPSRRGSTAAAACRTPWSCCIFIETVPVFSKNPAGVAKIRQVWQKIPNASPFILWHAVCVGPCEGCARGEAEGGQGGPGGARPRVGRGPKS